MALFRLAPTEHVAAGERGDKVPALCCVSYKDSAHAEQAACKRIAYERTKE